VDSIFVGGELCLPFLYAAGSLPIFLAKNCRTTNSWKLLARRIMRKGRRLGVKIVLPQHLVVGEEEWTRADILSKVAGAGAAVNADGLNYEAEVCGMLLSR
jgi:3-phosphoglycerate kinase